jgi:hypothetical protein
MKYNGIRIATRYQLTPRKSIILYTVEVCKLIVDNNINILYNFYGSKTKFDLTMLVYVFISSATQISN